MQMHSRVVGLICKRDSFPVCKEIAWCNKSMSMEIV